MRKILFVIISLAFIFMLVFYCYKRENLHKEYGTFLKKQEDEYVNSFYKGKFRGVITYIKKYQEKPDEYVVSIKDNKNLNITIGKVEISNFRSIKEGDSVYKSKNSFTLNIFNKQTTINSIVKYK